MLQPPSELALSTPLSQMHTTSLDLAEMRRRLGGDDELVREIAGAFLDAVPQLRAELARAHEQADRAALVNAVHALRGTLLDITAYQAADLAREIERDTGSSPDQIERLFDLVDAATEEAKVLAKAS